VQPDGIDERLISDYGFKKCYNGASFEVSWIAL
jgi:hypothetical protein